MSHLGKHLRHRKAARIADHRERKPRDAVLVVDDGDHYGNGIARALQQLPRDGRCIVVIYCDGRQADCDAHELDHRASGRDPGPMPAVELPLPCAEMKRLLAPLRGSEPQPHALDD